MKKSNNLTELVDDVLFQPKNNSINCPAVFDFFVTLQPRSLAIHVASHHSHNP